jgi:pre-rRNA-processing protein TSR3
MPSSGSTRNPPRRFPIRRYVLIVGDDHPKACTGRRLLHRGLAATLSRPDGSPVPPVVLDPFAMEPLSRADRAVAERGGLVAVDCSWNRISDRGRLPAVGGSGRLSGPRRRLPLLVATNPQHYGRVGELNTAEALAASLCVLGQPNEAEELLRGFSGGPAFFEVNRERLGRYARARSAEAVREAERDLYGRV